MKVPDSAEIAQYVDAQATLHGLSFSAAQRQGVIQNLTMALKIISPLLDAELPARAAAAGFFKAEP